MSLSVDYRKMAECLEDSLDRLECLKDCHLAEYPLEYLPDFVFPLEKALVSALEQLESAQEQELVLESELAAAQRALVEVEEKVEVLEPGQVLE